ncbi:MAG TPA: hypothetical protein VM869_27325 [Enhygromyxa sp.]|nr:hypothetical protein [Enhygromyxa sp.]
MSKHTLTLPVIFALAASLGCDEPKQATDKTESETATQASYTLAAKELELAAVVELVEREDVRDAESLEALLNADDSTIDVDIDKDGKRDFVSVHEVTVEGEARAELAADVKVEAQAEEDGALTITGDDGQKVRFELRAIPSSKVEVEVESVEVVSAEVEAEAVTVATVDIELHAEKREVVVEASYAPTVVVVSEVEIEHTYVHHIELEHRHDHLVVVGAPFIAWVWIDVRPVYVGHVHLPPGHAKKLGLHWHHPGHGHGHHKHGHHGHHGHGGPDKVHVEVHEHGGPDKVHVKVHDDHGGGGKVHFKAKGGHVKAKGGKGGKGKH